jgi:hypothetical protein
LSLMCFPEVGFVDSLISQIVGLVFFQ